MPKSFYNEQGSLILMALLIMLVLSILGTAVISLASLERKISHYSCEGIKAQEAADAGVDWAIEKICLNFPSGSSFDFEGAGTVSLEVETEKIAWTIVDYDCKDNLPDYNIYTFTSEGTYQRITKKVKVKLIIYKTDLNKRSITYYALVPGT